MASREASWVPKVCRYYSINHLLLTCWMISLQSGYRKRREGNGGRGQEPWCERCESFEGRWRRGKFREFSTNLSLLLNQSALTDFLNPFLCNQGIGNVAKETEDKVKRHGVKGVQASKDDGIEESFVSFRQICHFYSIHHLLLTFSIHFSAIRVSETSRRKRRTRSSAMVWTVWKLRRTMASRKALWVFDKFVIITQSIISYWLFESISLQSGYRVRREGNGGQGQAPWCERCEGFEGRWRRGKLRECRKYVVITQPIISTDLLNDLSAIRVSETSQRKRRTRSSAMVWTVWKLRRTMASRKASWVFDKFVIITQSIISYWLFESISLQSGYRVCREGNGGQGQAPWCERCEGFEGRWRRGKLRECRRRGKLRNWAQSCHHYSIWKI